jgi:ABC-2 type transport system permease protein
LMTERFLLAATALWKREMLHFWRERSRVLGFALTPLLFWVVVGSGFGDLGFYFPGALLLSIVFTGVFSTMSLIEDRKEGFLVAALASPAPRTAIVAGKVLGGACMAVAQGALFIAVLPLTGRTVSVVSLAAAAAVLFLTGLAFTGLGFLLAWHSRTAAGFHAVMNLVLMPLWMVSGALFPGERAHGWMRAVMAANPMSYTLNALRASLDGRIDPAGIAVTAACAGLAVAASAAALRRSDSRRMFG